MAGFGDQDIKVAASKYDQEGKVVLKHVGDVFHVLGLKLSDSEVTRMLSANGYSDSDQLATSDFLQLVSRLARAKQRELLLRDEFRKCDTNGDGIISIEEARRALEAEGVSLQREEIEAIMKVADINGDGKVDYEEFVRFVSPS